jgi:hypothetical protein
VLDGVKGALAPLGGSAALDAAYAPRGQAIAMAGWLGGEQIAPPKNSKNQPASGSQSRSGPVYRRVSRRPRKDLLEQFTERIVPLGEFCRRFHRNATVVSIISA